MCNRQDLNLKLPRVHHDLKLKVRLPTSTRVNTCYCSSLLRLVQSVEEYWNVEHDVVATRSADS